MTFQELYNVNGEWTEVDGVYVISDAMTDEKGLLPVYKLSIVKMLGCYAMEEVTYFKGHVVLLHGTTIWPAHLGFQYEGALPPEYDFEVCVRFHYTGEVDGSYTWYGRRGMCLELLRSEIESIEVRDNRDALCPVELAGLVLNVTEDI